MTCRVPDCPYDARRIYGTRPPDAWPNTVLTAGEQSLAEALNTGPYGQCVYLGLNNVADHQTVNVTFANGVTASLSVSAFTHNNTRTLKLLGTHGELRGHMDRGELELHDFRNGTIDLWTVDASGNHGGGDVALVQAWLACCAARPKSPLPCRSRLIRTGWPLLQSGRGWAKEAIIRK